VLLAHSSEEKVDKVLKTKLRGITEKTITDPEVLKQELVWIRDHGYALDNEEITRGIICAAAPVFGYNRELICAISLAFPAYIKEDRGIEPEIAAIKKYAAQISEALGRRKAIGECA
jgi:DNA-binding IclR family transcriptional regulator